MKKKVKGAKWECVTSLSWNVGVMKIRRQEQVLSESQKSIKSC